MHRPGHINSRIHKTFKKTPEHKTGHSMPTVIGFDTETCEGPPITVQFYSEHMPEINACIFVNEGNVLDKTIRHLMKHCKVGEFTIYGHNLTFDLLSLFYSKRELLATRFGDFELSHRDYTIFGVYGRPTFAILRSEKALITIVDTFSWFSTSLAKVSKLICPDLPKLPHPEGLGITYYKPTDTAFIEYAMRDAEVAFHAGVAIDDMHKRFDLRQAVSVADMASKIFCQHYILDSAPIWNCGREFNVGAVASYHGGKNNVIPGAAPAWHTGIDAWDLSSAYPHAMTLLPAFSDGRLFKHARRFSNRKRVFPEHGIYCVTGEAAPCDWPVVFSEDFKPIRGPFENEWITGYELNEARRIGEIKLSRVWGHVYDTDNDPVTTTAFARYVRDFYAKKQTATDPVFRLLYKVLLNSLYGKFIQSRQMESGAGGFYWVHGPLYHPFAASLITGHTRAVMHRLEHEVTAIHTATDGVFCGANNSPEDGIFTWAPQAGLGCIENEGRDLKLNLLRNKLYIAYTDDPTKGFKSWHRDDYVAKYAKHGFQGDFPTFERCAIGNIREYEVNKPNTLKTALKQGRVPNKFEKRTMTLNVDAIERHYDHSTVPRSTNN